MSNTQSIVRPTGYTINKVKRRAKTLKRDLGVKHSQGLDHAAKELGYSNYRHLLNMYEENKNEEDEK